MMKTITFKLGEENYKRFIFLVNKFIKHPEDLREIGIIVSHSIKLEDEDDRNN